MILRMGRRLPCARIRWTAAAIGLGGLIALVAAGCGSPPPSANERAEAEERWAETLGQLRAMEALELDRRVRLTEQQVELMGREVADAEQRLARAQTRKRILLGEMELDPSRELPAGGTGEGAWPDQLRQVQDALNGLQIESVQLSRRLVEVREELARLRRLRARQQMLTRLAAEQEQWVRELDRSSQRSQPDRTKNGTDD